MSDFSVFEHFVEKEVVDFFAGSSDPTVQAAGSALSTAGTALEQALPALGANMAEAAISKAGPLGQAVSPLLGLTIEAAITALLAKHPNPAAAKAAIAAS